MPDTPDTLRKRSRKVLLGTSSDRIDTYSAGPGGTTVYQKGNYSKYNVFGEQVTASEEHPQWHSKSAYEGDDIGGPFETTRRYLALDRFGDKPFSVQDLNQGRYEASAGSTRYIWYINGMLPRSLGNASQWPNPEPSSNAALMALGTKAIAITKPTNSIADLSVSLAEVLREGLPSLPGRSQWKERANVARGAGSEYLNAQFGWLPLISEIQNVAKVIDQGDKIWKQYERDAGRLVRRRYEFPMSVENPVTETGGTNVYPFPAPPTQFFQPQGYGTLAVTRHKRKRQWFSGAYTYYLPNKDDSSVVNSMLFAAVRARKLYGLTLDPEVLWNLTPWSWATDWFLNTGDVISNLTDLVTDGLLLRYGYMMEETIVSRQYTLSGLRWASSPSGPDSLTAYAVTKTLKRVRATPYGFGLIWSNFTPRQLAIMAALGITKKP